MEQYEKPTDAQNLIYNNYVDEHEPYYIKDWEITCSSPRKIVKHDHNSEMITFISNRYKDGIDLSTKIITIIGRNAKGINFSKQAENLYITDDKIKFCWVVDGKTTDQSGVANFKVQFLGAEGDEYEKNTTSYPLPVLNTVNFNNASLTERNYWYDDIMKQLTGYASEFSQLKEIPYGEEVDRLEGDFYLVQQRVLNSRTIYSDAVANLRLNTTRGVQSYKYYTISSNDSTSNITIEHYTREIAALSFLLPCDKKYIKNLSLSFHQKESNSAFGVNVFASPSFSSTDNKDLVSFAPKTLRCTWNGYDNEFSESDILTTVLPSSNKIYTVNLTNYLDKIAVNGKINLILSSADTEVNSARWIRLYSDTSYYTVNVEYYDNYYTLEDYLGKAINIYEGIDSAKSIGTFLQGNNITYLSNMDEWYETTYETNGSEDCASFITKKNFVLISPDGYIIKPNNWGNIFEVTTTITDTGGEQPEYLFDFSYQYVDYTGKIIDSKTFNEKYLSLFFKNDGWYYGFCNESTKNDSIPIMEVYNDAPYGLGIENILINMTTVNFLTELKTPVIYFDDSLSSEPATNDLWVSDGSIKRYDGSNWVELLPVDDSIPFKVNVLPYYVPEFTYHVEHEDNCYTVKVNYKREDWFPDGGSNAGIDFYLTQYDTSKPVNLEVYAKNLTDNKQCDVYIYPGDSNNEIYDSIDNGTSKTWSFNILDADTHCSINFQDERENGDSFYPDFYMVAKIWQD